MSQEALKEMLGQPGSAGAYRIPTRRRSAVEEAAKSLGFVCFSVELNEASDIGAVLASFGRDIDFPDWYGNNLDALNDCLTDLSWCDASGYLLVITGADAIYADPPTFASLNDVLANVIASWQSQKVPFWILFDLRGRGLPVLPTQK